MSVTSQSSFQALYFCIFRTVLYGCHTWASWELYSGNIFKEPNSALINRLCSYKAEQNPAYGPFIHVSLQWSLGLLSFLACQVSSFSFFYSAVCGGIWTERLGSEKRQTRGKHKSWFHFFGSI